MHSWDIGFIRCIFLSPCFLQGVKGIRTQWSRACMKSNSSSVHSSAVEDRELTLVSHCSKRSRAWTQCSAASHFWRSVSRGSCNRRYRIDNSLVTSGNDKKELSTILETSLLNVLQMVEYQQSSPHCYKFGWGCVWCFKLGKVM